MRLVTMTHPNLPGRTVEVPESAVPQHSRAGWQLQVAEPQNKRRATKPRKQEPAPELDETTTPESEA